MGNHFANVCLTSTRKPSAGQLHRVENITSDEEDYNSGNAIYTSECIGAVRLRGGEKWFITLQLYNK